MPSGFGPKGTGAAAFAQTSLENDLDDQLEASTVVGNGDPATLNRGPETVLEPARNPRVGRVDARELTFEEETQARPVDDRLLDKLRREDARAANAANAGSSGSPDFGVAYESLPSLEVRRPFDTYEAAFSERDPAKQLHAARESAHVRRKEQSYNEPQVAFEEPVYNDEPATPAYGEREDSYADSYAESNARDDQDMWGRREESGPRERPVPPPVRSYAAPVPSYDDASDSAQWGRDRVQPPSYRAKNEQQQGWSSMPPDAQDSRVDQPMIPPAPRVPEEMHPAFANAVQRIRTATPDAWGTPHIAPPAAGQYLPSPMQAIQSSLPPQYAQNQYPAYAYPHAYAQQAQEQVYYQPPHHQAPAMAYAAPQAYQAGMLQGQRQPTPMPAPMSASMHDRFQRAQPVGGQLATQPAADAASAKISRFVWFVAGAAFGITFAFFATGFFNGTKAQKDEAPAAATTAAAPVVAPTAPPAALAAPAPPVALAAPAQTAQAFAAPVTPASLPAVAPSVPAIAPVAPQAAAPVAPAVRPAAPPAPPRAPRFQAPPPRRPAPPVSQGPRNLGGGGPGADDDRPAPAAPPPGAELGDLLGAGLKP